MSSIGQLLCNKFGGIRERNAAFNGELITAQDLQNVELYYTGADNGIGIRTVKGNVSINSELEGTARIIKLFESVQKQEKYFFVYAETEEKGTLYFINDELGTLDTLKDNLTVTGMANGFDVMQGWSDLFFFTNGTDMFTVEMNVIDEQTLVPENIIVDMTPVDADGRDVVGINALIFDSRLWIAKDNILWYSKKADIYTFDDSDPDIITTSGYIERLKNITAIHEYLGTLAVFFADSSEQISVSSNGDFSIGQESPGGCAGFNTLVFHDTNLYFYDDTKKAVFSFRQVITGEKTLGENVAVDIQNILNNIDSDKLNEIQAYSVFIEGRNEIWWILPTEETYEVTEIVEDEETTVTKQASIILIYDYLKGEWIKRKSQKINSVSTINGLLYSAAEDGNILEEYNSDTFNGDFINHYYNCSPCNLGADNTLKVLCLPPRVSFDMPYNNQFYVKYVKNYNTFKTPKTRFIKSKLKNYMYWGVGFWGLNFWADKHTSIVGKFPTSNFKILEISLYTTDVTQSFSIRNIEFSKIKVKQV